MADIPLRANVCGEEFSRVLEIRHGQLHGLSSERYPCALPQQLDNATRDAGCQIEYVVDRDCIVDYFRRVNSQLHKEAPDKAAKVLIRIPGGEGARLEATCD
jgi:hypothetical protein